MSPFVGFSVGAPSVGTDDGCVGTSDGTGVGSVWGTNTTCDTTWGTNSTNVSTNWHKYEKR